MKKYIVFLCLSALFLRTEAQSQWNSIYQKYIDEHKDLAIKEMMNYNIPASITLAQALLESQAGQSRLATTANNHFGLKCHDTWSGATIAYTDDTQDECFRAYDNVRGSYKDHSKYLKSNPRYANLFNLQKDDYRSWAYGLKDCGYATDTQYPNSLIQLIDLYKLYQYDGATSYDKDTAARIGAQSAISTGNQPLHPIVIYNNNYYLVARDGDTFQSIGEEVGISARHLARVNERSTGEVLHQGDYVYFKKKSTSAEEQYAGHPHIVKSGESMYGIAQMYGMRLSSLYDINNLSPDTYNIRVGDRLNIYKEGPSFSRAFRKIKEKNPLND